MTSTCGCPKYYKYKNSDPSTAKYAPIITAEISEIIEEKIDRSIKRIYHVRPESVLGIDLKHAIMRELFHQLHTQVLKIDNFEAHNSGDLRNYPWSESEE